MPSKTVLSAKNLEALGAERLAALLLEISAANAPAKRRLKLELAGEESPGEAARAIAKRLAVIAKSRSFVDWRNRKGLADDLESQRRADVKLSTLRDYVRALGGDLQLMVTFPKGERFAIKDFGAPLQRRRA